MPNSEEPIVETAPEAAPAPTLPARIEPTEDVPEPTPTTGGNWVRHADGGLAPADEATAQAAGLRWPA